MNTCLKKAILLAILTQASLALGQANDFVNFPAGNMAFTIDISYPKPTTGTSTLSTTEDVSKNAPAKLTKIVCTQYDEIQRLQLTNAEGKTWERWTLPSLSVYFEEDTRNGKVATMPRGGLAASYAVHIPDISSFDWINADAAQNRTEVTYLGKKCFHYSGTATIEHPGSLSNPSYKVNQEAWIERETLVPVALDTGMQLDIFTFQKAPENPLVVPKKFQDKLTYYKTILGVP